VSTSPSGSGPAVSVIVGARRAADTIQDCLDSLRPECAGGRVETLVAAPVGDPVVRIVAREYPWVRVVEVAGWPNIAELRGAAIAVASGAIIAITDAHCTVEPGWIAAIERALDGADVAAGAVRNGSRKTAANCAAFLYDYGAFLPPIAARPTTTLAGNNIAYRRAVLGELGEYAPFGFWKAFVNQTLAASGRQLVATPEMVVSWRRETTLADVVRLRFHFGRCFGASRLRSSSRVFAATYRLAAPALPLVVIASAAWRLAAKPGPIGSALRAAPGFFAIAAAWGVGETIGALFGRGASCREVY